MKTKNNEKQIIDIDISLIDENPDNAAIFSMNEIESLARSIEKEGFLGAILVFEKKDGRYEISSGHRRVRAVKSLGRKTIPAIVTPMPEDEAVRRTALLSSNIHNRDMTPMDYARAIAYHENTLRIKYNTGNSSRAKNYKENVDINKELGEYFNLKSTSLKKYKRLMRLIPELQDLVDKRVVPISPLCDANRLDEKGQKKLYERIIKEIDSITKLDSSGDTDRTLPRYIVKRLLDDIKNEALVSDPAKTATEKLLNATSNDSMEDKEETSFFSSDSVEKASFFTDFDNNFLPTDNREDREAYFNNFFSMVDSFMKLDVSSLDKKRKAELRKKLERILKML